MSDFAIPAPGDPARRNSDPAADAAILTSRAIEEARRGARQPQEPELADYIEMLTLPEIFGEIEQSKATSFKAALVAGDPELLGEMILAVRRGKATRALAQQRGHDVSGLPDAATIMAGVLARRLPRTLSQLRSKRS